MIFGNILPQILMLTLPIFPFGSSKKMQIIKIYAFISFIIFCAVLQDFFQSLRNNYGFYLSESLLFKVFWLLFVPVAFGCITLSEKIFSTKRVKWHFLIKTLVFIGLAIPIHSVLFSLSVNLLSAVFFDHTYSVLGNLTYTFTSDSLIYIVVYGGIGFLLFHREALSNLTSQHISSESVGVKTEQEQAASPKQPALQQILVGTTKHRVVVPLDEIICINSSAPYVAIFTKHKDYLHSETLKSLEETLPKQYFVRIHKSTIINVREVISYTSRLNGDYDIRLSNQHEVRLSRNYAKEFKERFEGTSSPHLAQSPEQTSSS